MYSLSVQALQQQQEVAKAESSAEEKRINELRWKADADLAAEMAERAKAEQAVSGCHLFRFYTMHKIPFPCKRSEHA